MIKKATLEDAKDIYELINIFAKKRKMLPRSLNYVYENIRDFWIEKKDGKLVGCCALHVVGWNDLAEIKSLSVDSAFHGQGIGKSLLKKCLTEAKTLGVKQIFVLTYVDGFFSKNGFKVIKKEDLPQKIWTDCVNCSFFPNCNEIAMWRKIS